MKLVDEDKEELKTLAQMALQNHRFTKHKDCDYQSCPWTHLWEFDQNEVIDVVFKAIFGDQS